MNTTHSLLLAMILLTVTPSVSKSQSQSPSAAPRLTTTLPAAERQALEAIRKDVWVRWFAGDTAALRRILAPELVAISPDGQQTLTQSLASSAQFAAGGGKLVSITFDSTSLHRFGDVIVMYSRYALITETKQKPTKQQGRATEVFVRANGRWVHTSWHLDAQ